MALVTLAIVTHIAEEIEIKGEGEESIGGVVDRMVFEASQRGETVQSIELEMSPGDWDNYMKMVGAVSQPIQIKSKRR